MIDAFSNPPSEYISDPISDNAYGPISASLSNEADPEDVQSVLSRYHHVIMNTYGTPSLVLKQGHGCWVEDILGNKYLDLLSGVAVNALGQTNTNIINAISDQIHTLGHVSNYYATVPVVTLAERLIEQLGVPGKVFFCNSGTEANEAAIKLTRKTGRKKIVAAKGAFHGRSMGSLALTGQPEKQSAFLPLIPDVIHVPYGDSASLAAHVNDETAAIILEPIMGECGVIIPPDGYLAAVRDIATQVGALLIFDEVQTGIGRTGYFYAHQSSGVVPDVLTLAKGLGGGLPLGAMIGIDAAADLFVAGDHGSTFGGNPICAAAALAVIDVVSAPDFLREVKDSGGYLRDRIVALDRPEISDVRGAGLLNAVQLTSPIAHRIVKQGYHRGVLLNATSASVIRIAPPLIITRAEIDIFIERLDAILDRIAVDEDDC